MTAPRRIAVAVAVSLLFTMSSHAAAVRRRTVTMPAVQPAVSIAVSEEHRVTVPGVLAGAAGWPEAIAADGNATAIAWTSPDHDQTYVGIFTTGTNPPQFGTLLPDATTATYDVKIAANGGGFVVAWTTRDGIRTATLDEHGLTPGVAIPAPGDRPVRLQLASDADRYLLGWQAGGDYGHDSHYYGQLLDRAAHVIGSRFDLGPGTCVYNGLLNGGAGSFVAVLALDNCLGESMHALYARSISHNGGLGPAENFGAGDVATGQSLSSNGSDYFITWTPYPYTADRRISRISRQGHVALTATSAEPIAVVGTAGDPVLLYYDAAPDNYGQVAAVHLNDQLQPAGPKTVLLPAGLDLNVSNGPGDVQITYGTSYCDMCPPVVTASRWSASSLTRVVDQVVFSRLREQRHPSIAAYGGRYVMAWEEEADGGAGTRVVYSTGDASGWSVPTAVPSSSTVQRMPVIAAAGDGFAIAWEEPPLSVRALVVRGDGTTTPLQLFDNGSAPAIASDGTSFLVVAGSSTSPPHFSARRVSLTGDAAAEVTVAVPPSGPAYDTLSLVAVGSQWLVAYDVNFNCRLGGCAYATYEQSLDGSGSPLGQPMAFNVNSVVRHAPDLAANGSRAQMIFWDAAEFGPIKSIPPTVLTRQVAPGLSGTQTLADLDNSRYGPWGRESSAIAAFGSGYLAAWVAYDRQQVMLSSINGTPSEPLAVSSNLAVRYVDVATRGHEGLVAYTRRLTDSQFGSSLQLMVRAVGVAP